MRRKNDAKVGQSVCSFPLCADVAACSLPSHHHRTTIAPSHHHRTTSSYLVHRDRQWYVGLCKLSRVELDTFAVSLEGSLLKAWPANSARRSFASHRPGKFLKSSCPISFVLQRKDGVLQSDYLRFAANFGDCLAVDDSLRW